MKPLLEGILAVAPSCAVTQVDLAKALIGLLAAMPSIPTGGMSAEVWASKTAACIRTALGHLRRLKQNNTKWRQAIRFMAATEVAALKSLADLGTEVEWSHADDIASTQAWTSEAELPKTPRALLSNVWGPKFDIAAAAAQASKQGGLKALAGAPRGLLKRRRVRGANGSQKASKGGDDASASAPPSTPVKAEKIDGADETPEKALPTGEKPRKTPGGKLGKGKKPADRRAMPRSAQLGSLQLSVGALRSELCCYKDGVRQFVFAIHAKKTKMHGELAQALVAFATENDVTKDELRHMAKVKAHELSRL